MILKNSLDFTDKLIYGEIYCIFGKMQYISSNSTHFTVLGFSIDTSNRYVFKFWKFTVNLDFNSRTNFYVVKKPADWAIQKIYFLRKKTKNRIVRIRLLWLLVGKGRRVSTRHHIGVSPQTRVKIKKKK